MMEEKEIRFEAPEKPELTDLKEVAPDCQEFSNPEKAEAVIKSLSLSVGDTIREDSEEQYTINPRMVLSGTTPGEYKNLVENVKEILTKKEIYSISRYIQAKKENQKRRDEIYYSIKKRVNKFYKEGEVREDIKDQNIKDALIELQKSTHGFSNTIYHLLNNNDYLICYKNAWDNKPIPNQQEWREEEDGKYRVLTDSEADDSAMEYLTDDTYLWTQSVEAGNTTESLNDWAENVLSCDGRGSVLNGYDGCEEYEKINGTDYFIYRTN